MRTELQVPIAIALATGLGFLAFNDPLFFKEVSRGFMILAVVAFIATGVWSAALMNLSGSLYRKLGAQHYDTVKAAAERLDVPFVKLAIATFVLVGYCIFLSAWADSRLAREAQRTDQESTVTDEHAVTDEH